MEYSEEVAKSGGNGSESVYDAIHEGFIDFPGEDSDGVSTFDGALGEEFVDAEMVGGSFSPGFPFGCVHPVVFGKFLTVDEPAPEHTDGECGGCAPEDGFGQGFLDEVHDGLRRFVMVNDDAGGVEPIGEVDTEEEPAATDDTEGSENHERDKHCWGNFVGFVGFVEVVVMLVGGEGGSVGHFGIGVEETVDIGAVVIIVGMIIVMVVIMVMIMSVVAIGMGGDESPSFVAAKEGHVSHAGHVEGGEDGYEEGDTENDLSDRESVPGQG